MKSPGWLKHLFKRPKRIADPDVSAALREAPLREFVYLDEVTLRSLLSSQTGEMTDSTSERSVDTLGGQVSATLGANPALLAKAELASRFQTTNSSTIQTSRKATVQSWFREFYDIPNLRLIEPTKPSGPASDIKMLKHIGDRSLVVKSSSLRRGALVEFRVKLKADPVFHLGTMVSEVSAMAEDYPEMFAVGNGLETLRQAQPINKILQRLLAGLIPVRAEAIDYSIVAIDDIETVVHNGVLDGLDLERRPLEVVGVTEHLAYWKDIRRVLFSEAEFTLLARVARDALHDTWTPVKLANLFHEVAPDLINQINTASRLPFGTTQLLTPAVSTETRLSDALRTYADALLGKSNQKLTAIERERLDVRIEILGQRASSVSEQRTAFREVKDLLIEFANVEVDPDEDLELREAARSSVGLSLFPALGAAAPVAVATPTPVAPNKIPRLLDVEVIALYW